MMAIDPRLLEQHKKMMARRAQLIKRANGCWITRHTFDLILAAVMAVVLLLVLPGCAAQPQTHEVPVAVSCVEKRPVRPQFYTDDEVKRMDDYRVVLALRLDRALAQKYIGELEDVVTACEHAPSVVTVPR